MPTIMRSGPYRLFFYPADGNEPPHVHVERDDNEAKFWLEPVRLARNDGFRSREIRLIQDIIEEHRIELLEIWYEYFGH